MFQFCGIIRFQQHHTKVNIRHYLFTIVEIARCIFYDPLYITVVYHITESADKSINIIVANWFTILVP